MKKLITILFIIITIPTLLSCISTKKEGELTVWWPGGSDAEKQAVLKAKDLYEKDNPGVKINVVPQQTTNFWMDYTMAINGTNYPDIAYIDHVYIQRLAFEGYIANLSEAGADSIKDKYIPSLIQPNLYEGSLYALPMSANVLTTVVNKTLVRKVLGLSESAAFPNVSTLADLEYIAKAVLKYNSDNNLTGDNAYIPYTIPSGVGSESMGAMSFLSYVARFGGAIMSTDLKTMTLNSEACVNAAKLIYSFGNSGKKYSESVFGEGKFESGRVAIIEMGPWKIPYYSQIAEERNLEFGWYPIIELTAGGTRQSGLGLFSLVVTDKSINRDIAIDFIKFITTNDELQLLHNTAQYLMPTTKTGIQDEFYSTPVWDIYRNQLNNIVYRPGSPEWSTIETELASYVTNLLNGSRDYEYLTDLNIVLQRTLNDIYS